ncbi:MFS transporter [candidate division WOR-3 bacterium]|nr:MFS transporter [candidate division WOR-3 bacterium]
MKKRSIFIAISLAIFSSMLGVGIISPLLPIYAKTLGATGIQLGVIFASFSVARIISMPMIGKASDRYGRKIFICSGLLIYAIMSIGYVLSESMLGLLIVRFSQGFAAGMILPVATAYIGDIVPEGQEGKYMGLFYAFFFAGFGVGPIIGGVISDAFGIDFAFYLMGGLNLIAFFLALFLLPTSETHRPPPQQKSYLEMLKESNVVKGLFCYRLSTAGARSIFACFLPIFGGINLGLSSSAIGMLISMNILLNSVLQVPGGRLADKLSRRKLIAIGIIIDAICLLLIPLMHNFSELLAVCILSSSARAFAIPSAAAIATGEGRKYGMGSSMGIFNMAMSIGMAIGPFVGGWITDAIGVKFVFLFAALAEVVGIALFAKFTGSRKSPS